jgi:hypothetical protein
MPILIDGRRPYLVRLKVCVVREVKVFFR